MEQFKIDPESISSGEKIHLGRAELKPVKTPGQIKERERISAWLQGQTPDVHHRFWNALHGVSTGYTNQYGDPVPAKGITLGRVNPSHYSSNRMRSPVIQKPGSKDAFGRVLPPLKNTVHTGEEKVADTIPDAMKILHKHGHFITGADDYLESPVEVHAPYDEIVPHVLMHSGLSLKDIQEAARRVGVPEKKKVDKVILKKDSQLRLVGKQRYKTHENMPLDAEFAGKTFLSPYPPEDTSDLNWQEEAKNISRMIRTKHPKKVGERSGASQQYLMTFLHNLVEHPRLYNGDIKTAMEELSDPEKSQNFFNNWMKNVEMMGVKNEDKSGQYGRSWAADVHRENFEFPQRHEVNFPSAESLIDVGHVLRNIVDPEYAGYGSSHPLRKEFLDAIKATSERGAEEGINRTYHLAHMLSNRSLYGRPSWQSNNTYMQLVAAARKNPDLVRELVGEARVSENPEALKKLEGLRVERETERRWKQRPDSPDPRILERLGAVALSCVDKNSPIPKLSLMDIVPNIARAKPDRSEDEVEDIEQAVLAHQFSHRYFKGKAPVGQELERFIESKYLAPGDSQTKFSIQRGRAHVGEALYHMLLSGSPNTGFQGQLVPQGKEYRGFGKIDLPREVIWNIVNSHAGQHALQHAWENSERRGERYEHNRLGKTPITTDKETAKSFIKNLRESLEARGIRMSGEDIVRGIHYPDYGFLGKESAFRQPIRTQERIPERIPTIAGLSRWLHDKGITDPKERYNILREMRAGAESVPIQVNDRNREIIMNWMLENRKHISSAKLDKAYFDLMDGASEISLPKVPQLESLTNRV